MRVSGLTTGSSSSSSVSGGGPSKKPTARPVADADASASASVNANVAVVIFKFTEVCTNFWCLPLQLLSSSADYPSDGPTCGRLSAAIKHSDWPARNARCRDRKPHNAPRRVPVHRPSNTEQRSHTLRRPAQRQLHLCTRRHLLHSPIKVLLL